MAIFQNHDTEIIESVIYNVQIIVAQQCQIILMGIKNKEMRAFGERSEIHVKRRVREGERERLNNWWLEN